MHDTAGLRKTEKEHSLRPEWDEERLLLLAEAIDSLPIGTGITISDPRGRIVYANEAESAMHGYLPGELVGKEARLLAPPRLAPAGRLPGHDELCFFRRECLNVTKDGAEFPVQLTSIPIRNPQGRLLAVLTACEDITRRKECERQIEELAYYDPVTRLPNRTLLMDRLRQALALARLEGRELALLLLDLDNFKDLNSSRGHEAGDRFLKEVACRLSESVKDPDTLARLGGDEFVVVLNSAPGQAGAAATSERLQGLFSLPFTVDGEELYTTTSIGIALYPADGADVEALLRSADAALYQAKSGGKGGCRFFCQEVDARNLRRVELEKGMRQGLARGEFFLHFQPQWDLKGGRITGAEALLRWQSAEFGLVPPDEFIPIAEACGLIFDLGEYVLREACLMSARWARLAPDLRVAVNISGYQLGQPGFLDTVARIMAETGVPPRCLEFEFTESVIMERAERNIDALKALKGMGVRLSVDDFGTGYSSLSYLKHFPIDAIKIDRSFISELSSAGDDAAIAEAIISLAHSLKLTVLAEGVETAEQLAFLIARGCDQAQGYYFALPMPVDEFLDFLGIGQTATTITAGGAPAQPSGGPAAAAAGAGTAGRKP